MKALAVATGIVFWTLVLGTAFLAFFPGSDSGPVAILQIEPAAAPAGPSEAAGEPALPEPEGAAAPAETPPAEGNVDLPPGFATTPSEGPPA
ncbi:MAG: hypothetical protein H7X78_04655, partial [Methyloceanibacter sp.]|nr:hypothetical protein [Methyloceanibacter sp.]